MPRPTTLLLALATLSATTLLYAQSPDPAGPASATTNQTQPAPIERPGATYPGGYGPQDFNGDQGPNGPAAQGNYTPRPRHMRPAVVAGTLTTAQPLITKAAVTTAEPTPGIFLRVAPNSAVSAVALSAPGKDAKAELRIDRGLVNISVHHPEDGSQILVDLPGGQTTLIKDGFYTFNAATNTVRVLKGEALTYPANGKKVKIKEDHSFTLAGTSSKTREFDPMEARADLIPYNPYPEGATYAAGGGYGYPGGYGEGFYGGYDYPYYGYGYPYGFYGYPFGIGLGFGYYGGFGGGYRGGYGGWHGGGGGFHGGGGHR